MLVFSNRALREETSAACETAVTGEAEATAEKEGGEGKGEEETIAEKEGNGDGEAVIEVAGDAAGEGEDIAGVGAFELWSAVSPITNGAIWSWMKRMT